MPSRSECCLAALLVCACLVSASAAVTVNPSTGIDSTTCGSTPSPPCKTIAYAVRNLSASFVVLSAGVFNESAVNITGAESLVISGVPSATVFDCSSRSGPAFKIVNSTVSITGVTFQACSNPIANGGAVSANGSSVVVSQCSFMNCSAASGGAMSVSGPGGGLYLNVQNSSFSGNSAIGGLAGCPADPTQPCSTWGGAVAAFEMLNVTVSGCRMVNNNAQASMPPSAPQYRGGNAVAGGGCVSVLFAKNTSGSSVRVSDNTFSECTVTLSVVNNVNFGNGTLNECLEKIAMHLCVINACAGYGGALSVYFGFFAGLQLLDVSYFSLALHRNAFSSCTVIGSLSVQGISGGGNVYGGGVSLYMGGYSSSADYTAVAAVGDTTVRHVNVSLDTVRFILCSALATQSSSDNAYGGAFSFYVGAYAYAFGILQGKVQGSSKSSAGSTFVAGVSVLIRNSASSDCSGVGASSFGGSMSVIYVGAYVCSYIGGGSVSAFSSSAVCGATNVTDLVVSIKSSTFAHSSTLVGTFCIARLEFFNFLTESCSNGSKRRLSSESRRQRMRF